MAEEGNPRQQAEGEGIAQAQDHSTAIVQTNNYYEHVPPRPVDAETVSEARRKLYGLPLDEVPDVVVPLPHGSRAPSFGPNSAFVGREEELKILARNLKGSTETTRPITAGVAGVGGVGKTQLAGEFVYRYGQYFEGGVYWLSFADADNVRAEIVSCGSSGSPELGSDFPRLPFDEKIKRITAAWQSALPRLLVFDNCEDVKLLAFWAPPSGGCRVLITSRGKLEDPVLGLHFVELDILSRQESVTLLRKYLSDIPAEDSVLNAIAEELGNLPLALDLAGRFLVRYQITDTPHDYLADLVDLRESDALTLLNHESLEDAEGVSPTRHEMSVARTFALDLRRLDATDQIDGLALKVLARAACLAPDESIPRRLLLSTLDLPDGDREAARRAEDAVRRLTQLGLVQGREDVKMHRLVKVAVASAIDDPQARPEVENSVADAVGYLAEAGNYQAVLPLLPHLRFLTNSIGQRQDPLAGYMCFVLGGTLTKMQNKKDYEEALSHTERALSIYEGLGRAYEFKALRILLNLGAIRKVLGHLDEAITVYGQALKASRRVCGRRDPETAYVHNNLGSALREKAIASEETRFLVKALRHYKRALKIREKKRPQHPDLAESLTNMGALMVDLCHYEDAWGYLQRSLQIVGEPPVPLDLRAYTLRLLGRLALRKGNYAEARSYLSQSFQTYNSAFGPNHPQTKKAKELIESLNVEEQTDS